MKVAILAGGLGTRLSEETNVVPKPMVEIGGRPMLWHIMKIYSSYGFNEFVILLGYKGHLIKQYFHQYFLHQSDVTFDIKNNKVEIHSNQSEPWKITLVDTGIETQTGGRVLRAKKYLEGETFMLTYGDGVSNINITSLLAFHKAQKKEVTLTAVQPEGRFGALNIKGNLVTEFVEKPLGDGAWINGGFFVCEPSIFGSINEGDKTIFESNTLDTLSRQGKVAAFKHTDFWKPMDTLRDKQHLENLWSSNSAPWKTWD
jgi:glucose-1-phosphate cytidylyltransferase